MSKEEETVMNKKEGKTKHGREKIETKHRIYVA